jgi:hypothetical protein
MSPYENWQKLAWAGVFLITVAVLASTSWRASDPPEINKEDIHALHHGNQAIRSSENAKITVAT